MDAHKIDLGGIAGLSKVSIRRLDASLFPATINPSMDQPARQREPIPASD
jgi:hypothetical protein